MCENPLIFIDIHIFKNQVKSLSMKDELQWPTTRIFHFDGWCVQNNVGVNEIQHLSSPPDISGVRVVRAIVFSVVFCRSLFIFLGGHCIVFVLLYTASDCFFGIFKLFFNKICNTFVGTPHLGQVVNYNRPSCPFVWYENCMVHWVCIRDNILF